MRQVGRVGRIRLVGGMGRLRGLGQVRRVGQVGQVGWGENFELGTSCKLLTAG